MKERNKRITVVYHNS